MKKLFFALMLVCFPAVALAQFPTYIASGTFTATQMACTPVMPSFVAGDLLLLVAESENEVISLTTANGFVEIPSSPQGAGTALTDPANRIAVYYKRAVGSDSAPVVADSGDHTTCQVHAFRGVRASGNPWDVTAGGNDGGVNDTTANIPGATTTVANTLVVLIQGTSNNANATTNCGAVTNADLASITERADNASTQGLGGGHCLITGTKATIGSYATSTLTMTPTTFKGAISLALAPALCSSAPGAIAHMGAGAC